MQAETEHQDHKYCQDRLLNQSVAPEQGFLIDDLPECRPGLPSKCRILLRGLQMNKFCWGLTHSDGK